jgi:hypothetical protein
MLDLWWIHLKIFERPPYKSCKHPMNILAKRVTCTPHSIQIRYFMREPPLRKTWECSNITQPLSSAMKEVCLEDLIKPNQASHQGARWTSSVSMRKVPDLALIIEASAVWPWYRRSFQGICRELWIIIAELTCGLFPMIFRMVFPSCEISPKKLFLDSEYALMN